MHWAAREQGKLGERPSLEHLRGSLREVHGKPIGCDRQMGRRYVATNLVADHDGTIT